MITHLQNVKIAFETDALLSDAYLAEYRKFSYIVNPMHSGGSTPAIS